MATREDPTVGLGGRLVRRRILLPIKFHCRLISTTVAEFTAAHRWKKVQKCFKSCFEMSSHTIQVLNCLC